MTGWLLTRICASSFGFVPQNNNWSGLISYQFMHSGWLHVLGNLWFLWLVGSAIEDAWGRRLFVVFYLSAGVAAGIAHKLMAFDSAIPLLGASGAIAGTMGAFLFRHARTRIRMLVVVLFRWHIWRLPAYLILGLWLALEILSALTSHARSSGVAHFAHLGGFAYGLGVAWLLRKSGIERQIA